MEAMLLSTYTVKKAVRERKSQSKHTTRGPANATVRTSCRTLFGGHQWLLFQCPPPVWSRLALVDEERRLDPTTGPKGRVSS